ncbi:MAG: insulinase family protein, partial [bacterium]|nr:insulinase family protein [bacterium]
MKRLKTALLWVLLWGICIYGNGYSWAQSPISSTSRTWKEPVERLKIDDDFSFIFQRDETSGITIIHLLVKGGKAAVPVSRRGTAFIATRLSVDLPSSDNLRELMHLGSALASQTHGDFSTITIKSLSENLDKTLKIIAKVIKKPLLSGLRISNLKRFMQHNQKRVEDSPEQLMEETYLTAFNGEGDHGYGGSAYGSKESRKVIKRKDIANFYKRFFNSGNVTMTVSSNLDKAEITGIIQKHFASFPKGQPTEPPPIKTSPPSKKEIFLEKENQQVLISFGVPTPGVSRENFVRLYILENLLGKGIGSKIWTLRSRENLAYSLNTRFIQMHTAGLLIIYLKTENKKKEEALRSLKKLITGIYKNGITEDDLTVARVHAKADFLRSCETKEQRARQIAYFEAMGLGFDFLEGFFS